MDVKRSIIWMVSLMLIAGVGFVYAQTTQPTQASDRADLERRANEAFNRADYATALPLLEKLAVMSKDQPDVVGPILERIRVCRLNLPDDNERTGPRKPHVKPKPGEVLELQIKDLGNFDYDPDRGGNIPADVQALNGSTIRLIGFMIPMDQADNITQFALVPSLFACCFGQPPTIQHTIVVNCPKGKAVSYYPDEIMVEGVLTVEEKKEDDFIISIFEMEVSSVKPAVK